MLNSVEQLVVLVPYATVATGRMPDDAHDGDRFLVCLPMLFRINIYIG
jgi:hypothetical protein